MNIRYLPAERRERQQDAIKRWKPWEQSTKPKRLDSKARVSRNGWKSGARPLMSELARAFNKHHRALRRGTDCDDRYSLNGIRLLRHIASFFSQFVMNRIALALRYGVFSVFSKSTEGGRMAFQLFRGLIAIAASLALLGCASGYSQYYTQLPGATPERIAAVRSGVPPQSPAVERSGAQSLDTVADYYTKRGFGLIGYSVFNSGRTEADSAAVQKGADLKADLVVIMNPRYTGSITSAVPITVPTTTTSFSTGTATSYGARGAVTAYGSGTTTTYGTSTTMVPMTVHRQDYGAMYFVKRSWTLGVIPRDLSDAERQSLQSNRGVAVRIVVDGSPAFDADILPGDFLVEIDGLPVSNVDALNPLIAARSGKSVVFTVLRNGARVIKNVQLGGAS